MFAPLLLLVAPVMPTLKNFTQTQESSSHGQPISLPQTAINVINTGALSIEGRSVAGTETSTSEQAAQVHIQVKPKSRQQKRVRTRDESISRHKRCVHDKRQTRYLTVVLDLLFT